MIPAGDKQHVGSRVTVPRQKPYGPEGNPPARRPVTLPGKPAQESPCPSPNRAITVAPSLPAAYRLHNNSRNSSTASARPCGLGTTAITPSRATATG
jgi:hypothetical protein